MTRRRNKSKASNITEVDVGQAAAAAGAGATAPPTSAEAVRLELGQTASERIASLEAMVEQLERQKNEMTASLKAAQESAAALAAERARADRAESRIRELTARAPLPGTHVQHKVKELVAKAQAASKRDDDAHALHTKFAESSPFTLAFGDMPDFFGGLEKRVGQPSPNLRVAMRVEHCDSEDSHDEYTTGNYGIKTKPIVEWYAVVDPAGGLVLLKLDAYPAETHGVDAEGKRRGPGLKPLADFQTVLDETNAKLVAKGGGESRLVMEELIAGRLYTGPMFEKYSLVARSSIDAAPQFMKDQVKASCKGNRYTTTIHLLNSLIIKLSKLTKATTVYRGVARGVLPKCFWEENKEGVRGGIEAGAVATSFSQ